MAEMARALSAAGMQRTASMSCLRATAALPDRLCVGIAVPCTRSSAHWPRIVRRQCQAAAHAATQQKQTYAALRSHCTFQRVGLVDLLATNAL